MFYNKGKPMKLFSFMKNKIRGFSLMETMIASAILMIMALAFSTMMSDFSKQQRSVAVAGEANELFNKIGVALQNPLLCSASFVGQSINTAISSEQNLTHITFAASGSTLTTPIAGNVIAQVGLKDGNVKVTNLTFKITSALSASEYFADVIVSVEKSIGGSASPVGGSKSVRTFPVSLNVDTATNTVKNCIVNGGGGGGSLTFYRITAKGCGGHPTNGPISNSATCSTIVCYYSSPLSCGKHGCTGGERSGYYNCDGTTCVVGACTGNNNFNFKCSAPPAPATCPNVKIN